MKPDMTADAYDRWLTTPPEPEQPCPERGCQNSASRKPADEGRCPECADELRAVARGDI